MPKGIEQTPGMRRELAGLVMKVQACRTFLSCASSVDSTDEAIERFVQVLNGLDLSLSRIK